MSNLPDKPEKKERTPDNIADYESFCELRGQGLTYNEIGEILKYNIDTFTDWAKRSDYEEKVLKYRQKFKRQDLLGADKCVRNNLNKSNLKAAELVYKREGEISDKPDIKIAVITITDIIEAEKEAENEK